MAAGNPDVTDYVDLRLLDKDPLDYVDTALADAPAKVPGLLLPVGSQERVFLELVSLPISELGATINRHVGATVEAIHGGLFRVPRDLGTPPVATVRFVFADALPHEVPADVRMRVELGNGLDPLELLTDEATAGTGTADAPATGDRNTGDANGIPAGGRLELLTAVPYVEYVELVTDITGGADVEDDAEWFTRAQQRVDRLNDTLTQPHHFTAFALERADVTKATTLNLYNPDAGAGVPGDHEGHITTAVYGIAALLAAAAKDDLLAGMDDQSYAPLIPHVIDPTITAVAVNPTIVVLPGYDEATVAAAVLDELDAYLDPEAWDWAASVYRNELVALIDRDVDGVDRVVTVDVVGGDGAGNLALPGVAPLADFDRVGSTVTVV